MKISFNNLLSTVFIIVFIIFFLLTKILVEKHISNYIEPSVLTDYETIKSFFITDFPTSESYGMA